MLGWIFKKRTAPTDDKAAEPAPTARTAVADRPRPAPAQADIDWPARLQAAAGDDAALLALARAGAPLATQQAAIDAVLSVDALKQAERDWRGHDRRLHRMVKQRYLAQVAQREAREAATRLIDTATALQQETPIPTNRLVELDREWQALDTSLLEAPQRETYAQLLAHLTALTRERGDQALTRQRWRAEAQAALARLEHALGEVAAGTTAPDSLTAPSVAARTLVDGAPELDAAEAQCMALRLALNTSEQLTGHISLLDELLQTAAAPAAELWARWEARTPLADVRLDSLLAQRADQWRAARSADQQARRTEQRAQKRERQRELGQELAATLSTALDQGEAAVAAGQLADTHRLLVTIDELLNGAAAPSPLGARIDRLQAEYAQLKGWQHWGGGLARDELVLQAEALAAVSQREPDAGRVKLSLRQRIDVIDDMRARWKELDRLGGATSRALWQRFDAALKAAYEPVAEHQTQQREARAQNLQARLALIEALNAIEGVAAESGNTSDAAAPPDWRSLASALDHFRTEWRKLGPTEHTVPHQARDELMQRMEAAVARLEGPLLEVRRLAQLGRERLIARARSLADEARQGIAGRDSIDRVRELQAEWQHQARALPLVRAAETALWADFKSAVDAVFAAREEAFSAREAQFRAGSAERVALIEALANVTEDASPAELKRAIADADTKWQRAAPAQRQDAAGLETRFQAARDRLRERLGSHARRQWLATCDALAAKLGLCQEREAGADGAPTNDDLSQRWATHAPLPPAWEQALARRAGLLPVPAIGDAHAAVPTDTLLLQLEMALQLTTPEAHQGARRELKLLAMKAALEGRAAPRAASLMPGQTLAVLLGRSALDPSQSERLAAVLVAVRQGEPIDAG